MMTGALSRRAQELAATGTPFVTATVVRARRPTSVKAGDVALVLGDAALLTTALVLAWDQRQRLREPV